MPPADEVVTLLSSFTLKLQSAIAAPSRTPADGDFTRRGMRGGMPPADAIVALFSVFPLRLRSAAAACSCTPANGDARSAMRGGIPPAGRLT